MSERYQRNRGISVCIQWANAIKISLADGDFDWHDAKTLLIHSKKLLLQ